MSFLVSLIVPKNELENSNFCPSLMGQNFFVRFLEELKKQERKGFRSMIASSQFSNLQFGNLATWQFGNLAIWQLGNLATWQFGNLATCFQLWKLSKLATFNFGNF
jgi:hypothetical protein